MIAAILDLLSPSGWSQRKRDTWTMPNIAEDLARACTGAYLKRSLVVALIVGTILNLINQWDGCFGDAPIVWTKLLLTYCVPFFVATYGTFSALHDDGR